MTTGTPKPCDYIVTLPPPTPNGGLHVGHMAGPFLSADVFAKAMILKGKTVHVLSYSDTNQSYVRATAEKQGVDPLQLAQHWSKDIVETLAAYGCTLDDYFEPDAASDGFVRDCILRLFKDGKLRTKEMPFYYSLDREEFLDEAGVSGFCNVCLDDCKCGICEACGFVNNAETLLRPRSTNRPNERIELRKVKVMVLEIEVLREELRHFHGFSDGIRPKYRWLVDDAFAGPLPDFPVTVPGSWGIKVDYPGFPNQVINAWPEIGLDFVYGYEKLAKAMEKAGGDMTATPKVVNFFGFDNSYFYAFSHIALLHALGFEHYLPEATVINEFYNLENAKFSTSRGHLIWARDLADVYPADLVRFYTALTAPGFEQGNFAESDMRAVIETRLAKPYAALAASVNALLATNATLVPPSDDAQTIGQIAQDRVLHSLELDRFNLRSAAADLLRVLPYVETELARLTKAGQPDQALSDALTLLETWAATMWPLMPKLSVRLRADTEAARQNRSPLSTYLFDAKEAVESPPAPMDLQPA